MYGYSAQESRVLKWFNYVLKTKDWGKLRKYREDKIKQMNVKIERFDSFVELFNKDPRLRGGKRTVRRLLLTLYNIDIPLPTMGRYLKKIRESNELTNTSTF